MFAFRVCGRALAPALALAAVSFAGCGGDDDDDGDASDGGTPDGGTAIDAGGDCPGELAFEALVANAVDEEPVFNVKVAQVGGPNETTSAPNGRAALCLPTGADVQLESDQVGYLPRQDELSAEAIAAAVAAGQPYPLDVLSAMQAKMVFGAIGVEWDSADALVMVSVLSYPGGEPLVDARVSIEAGLIHDGAFERDGKGSLTASPLGQIGEVGERRLVLFANVPVTGGAEDGRAALTVAPPDGFGGTCVGSPSVAVEAGGMSGAFFACRP